MLKFNYVFYFLLISLFALSCTETAPPKQKVVEKKDSLAKVEFFVPDWAVNANIYEVNIRQFTKDGTFWAFEEHLDRLKEMGVDILWLMPIHPISEVNRKGTLGSYYAIQDYKAINYEFGTLDDFKSLVAKAHEMEMKVIIDWVANHTGWDNVWIEQHPDWYTKDEQGNISVPPGTDWTDVADLNYDNKEMRKAMIDAMNYWVTETDIDGFRCDVAGEVPIDFWIEARQAIEKNKPLFMLAEDGKPGIHEAFDASYGWDIHHIMNEIASGAKTCVDLDDYFTKVEKEYKPNDWILNFTSNHDENSWNGTAIERLGKGYLAFAVLSATIPGMPLIYNGQEVSLNKRLEFFEKDEIKWKSGKDISGFYKKLLNLKNQNKALWNGTSGGKLERVHTNDDQSIFAFVRQMEKEKTFVVLNLSPNEIEVDFIDKNYKGIYTELFTEEDASLTNDTKITLPAWGVKVYYK